ncbi:MAG: J domain-containing protein [Vibrio sp.]
MLKLIFLVSIFLATSAYAADIAILKSQAEANNVQAQYALALAYQQGDDVAVSPSQALFWFEKAAEQGNLSAMRQLVKAYQAEQQTPKNQQKVQFWLTRLALKGAAHAPLQLGNYYANAPQAKVTTDTLAELWYHIASANDPLAEKKYAQLLEEKFNQQRARQVASINQLEQAVTEPELSGEANGANEQSDTSGYVSRSNLLVVLVVILVAGLIGFVRMKKQRTQGVQHEMQQRATGQAEELLAKSQTIKQQKQQLKRLFGQLQLLQKSHKELQQQLAKKSAPSSPPPEPNEPHSQKMAVACAILGYTPTTLPDNKTIKVRYKQLCKIYHPDMKGSDDEMKRLNHAVKYLLAQRR